MTFVLTKRKCFTLVLVAKQRNSGLQNSDSQSSGPKILIVIMKRASSWADQPLLIWLFCNWRISNWTSCSPHLSYNASEVFVFFRHSIQLHNISTVYVSVLGLPQHWSRGILSSGIRRCVKGVKISRSFERHISFILKGWSRTQRHIPEEQISQSLCVLGFVASSGYSPRICVEELREAKKKNLPALLCPGWDSAWYLMNTGHTVTCTLHSLFNSGCGNGDTQCFLFKFILWIEREIL